MKGGGTARALWAMEGGDNGRKPRTCVAAVNFNGSAWKMSAGMINWAAGAEWSTESYQDIYDAAREAGNTLGSAGSSSSGDR